MSHSVYFFGNTGSIIVKLIIFVEESIMLIKNILVFNSY